jgi:hypothetical protein
MIGQLVVSSRQWGEATSDAGITLNPLNGVISARAAQRRDSRVTGRRTLLEQLGTRVASREKGDVEPVFSRAQRTAKSLLLLYYLMKRFGMLHDSLQVWEYKDWNL